MRELKIGTSSVRGVVGDALTPELIVNFACAFGTWVAIYPVLTAFEAMNVIRAMSDAAAAEVAARAARPSA